MFPDKRKDIPDGLWAKCTECGEIVYDGELSRNLRICSKCDYYFPLEPAERIAIIADEESLIRYDADHQYAACLDEKSCEQAIVTGEVAISDHRLIIATVNSVTTDRNTGLFVCEKIVRSVNQAVEQRLPLLMIYTNSNGPHNSTLLPAQTLSISASMSRLDKEKLLYISVLAHPNSQSFFPGFTCVADIVIAESNTPAVPIDNQINENGVAEAAQILFQNGMADMVISRKELKHTLADILNFFC